MCISSFVFDLGNVLLRGTGASPLRKWALHFGIQEEDLLNILLESEVSNCAFEGKLTEEEFWRSIGDLFSLNDEQLSRFQHDYYAGEELNPRMIQLISQLRPTYTTAILSNAWSNAREIFNSLYGLDSLVDDIIYSAEVGIAKPNELIYKFAAERLNVLPSKIVFIDDKEENVLTARRVGMRGILFMDAAQTISEVQKILSLSVTPYGRAIGA